MEPLREESSLDLLREAKAGSESALECLLQRYVRRLRRWSTRRLPAWARSEGDTDDLVQETLLNAFRNLQGIRMEHGASLRVYMRRAVSNRLRDKFRQVGRRPEEAEITDLTTGAPSALDVTIAREDLQRCRVAISRLSPDDRRLILLRLSQPHLTFKELAAASNRPSEDAARVALNRALARLADEMTRLETGTSSPVQS